MVFVNVIARGAAVATTADVFEGAIVKAIFIEMWIISNGLQTQFDLALYKAPAGAIAMTSTNLLNAGAYNNKKNILYFTQGLVGEEKTTNPMNVLKGWIKIPKGKQRFGLGDRLILSFTPTGVSTLSCGFGTFKDYS